MTAASLATRSRRPRKANTASSRRTAFSTTKQIVTRLEKLTDHLDGRSTAHKRTYIAAMKRYADLVFGENILAT